jgi:hypothetical protein
LWKLFRDCDSKCNFYQNYNLKTLYKHNYISISKK